MNIAKNKRRAVLFLLLCACFLALFSVFSTAHSPGVGEPEKVYSKDVSEVLSVSFKGIPGTIIGQGELKDSGELVSMKVENEFILTLYLPPDKDEKLHIGYTADNGKSDTVFGMTLRYRCSTPEDYTTLHVSVYNEKNEIVRGYEFTVKYDENVGFLKKAFWSFR